MRSVGMSGDGEEERVDSLQAVVGVVLSRFVARLRLIGCLEEPEQSRVGTSGGWTGSLYLQPDCLEGGGYIPEWKDKPRSGVLAAH